eukprot:8009503-Pyramimonas_sp.AAC.1
MVVWWCSMSSSWPSRSSSLHRSTGPTWRSRRSRPWKAPSKPLLRRSWPSRVSCATRRRRSRTPWISLRCRRNSAATPLRSCTGRSSRRAKRCSIWHASSRVTRVNGGPHSGMTCSALLSSW